MKAKELIQLGYRRVSNSYGIVARIDRPDWKAFMAAEHPGGMSWVESLSQQPGSAEDHYRRCYSKDTLELGRSNGRMVPSSDWDATGYIETPAEKATE